MAGHLADGCSNGCVLENDGRGQTLCATRGGVVIGNPPLRIAREGPGDVRLVIEKGLWQVSVKDDLEVAVAAGEELGNESI